jgi:hypothetical protein
LEVWKLHFGDGTGRLERSPFLSRLHR